MNRINIRTVNGARSNPHLDSRYIRVQNRAAAVLDAWSEFGEGMPIDTVAHLHRMPIAQIEKDLHGEPADIKRRFGLQSTIKLERALQKCQKELKKGENQALVAVANNVPFMVLRSLQDNGNIKKVASVFLNDMNQKLLMSEKENSAHIQDKSIETSAGEFRLDREPLSSIENRLVDIIETSEVKSLIYPERLDSSISIPEKQMDFDQSEIESTPKRAANSSSIQLNVNENNDSRELLNTDPPGHGQRSTSRPTDLHHRTKPFHPSQIQMEWKMLHTVGLGLNNRTELGLCRNICYINAAIQCLAVSAPFVQWLFTETIDVQCNRNARSEFCSVCSLYVIIDRIYGLSNHQSISSPILRIPNADAFVENIERVSGTFSVGTQQDPSEFLTFLLNHLIECLSPDESTANEKSITSIQHIFGINVQRKSRCHICSNESTFTNWESFLTVSIDDHADVVLAIKAFFNEQLLDSVDLYECTQCRKKVPGSTKLEVTKTSPILFVHLRKFTYDKHKQMVTKVHRFISYPEILSLGPYVNTNIQDSNKENDGSSGFTYQLYAVVVHQGETPSSGHIFSYIHSPDGLWYKANDETVTRVKWNVVLNEKDAYVLCYAKALTRPSLSLNKTSIDSSIESSSPIITSTPIHSRLSGQQNLDDNFNLIPSVTSDCPSPNEPSKENPINFDSILSEQSSIENDEVNVNSFSFNSCPSIPENKLSMQKTVSFDDIQTESRIEIIRNNDENRKNSNPRSQTDSTIDDSMGVDDFVTELPASFQFKLQSVDLAKLVLIRDKKIERKRNRLFDKMGLPNTNDVIIHSKKIFLSQSVNRPNTSSNNVIHSKDSSVSMEIPRKNESNVDVEYLYVLLPYLKRFNQYCGLCVRNCTFGVTKLNYRQLLRCNLQCIAHPTCPFKCSVIAQNNGVVHIVVTNRTIRHAVGMKICRPIRKPLRSLIKTQFSQGASVYRLHQERLQKRTREERKGRNYDGVGTSRSTLRKIKSEAVIESLLSPSVDDGLLKLLEQFRREVNGDGKVKGAIQFISKYPSQVIVYSETSIRLFDALLKHKNVVISWDATGSIIKETHARRMLYYELSITLPGIVNEDSIVPITFMISDAHALVNVNHWLELFKQSYAQVFVGKPFPQPRIVLSDRAMVFLLASLKVWNNETMNDFLYRAYRIVTGTADTSECDKTNIHACLAHVLLDARKTINKYIPDAFRDLAMWCIALLINSSTWNDFTQDWQFICLVFIQLHLGIDHVKKECYDVLLNRISKIQADPNTNKAIKSAEHLQNEDGNASSSSQIYTFDDDTDDLDSQADLPRSKTKPKRRKKLIDEEQEMIATDSPFKSHTDRIFNDALMASGVSIKEMDENNRGIMRWFKYLTTSFMPTLAVWSNLLLGDLSRHRRRLVQSFESIIVNNEEQRTTGISERRMGIVKRVQLGGEVHMRLDVLISILIPDMLSMIDEYNNALLSYCQRSVNDSSADSNMILDEQRLIPIHERWREKVSKRGRGYYTKCPDETVITDLLSCLLSSNLNINGKITLPNIIPNWLDVAIGMILSVRNYGEYRSRIPLSMNDNSLLFTITTFLDDWYKSSADTIRTTSVNFKVPDNEPQDLYKQSVYILDNIFTPLLPCHLIIDKIYKCESCRSNVKIRSTIRSIPVSISRSGLDVAHDLLNFFASTSSDLNCSVCKRPTNRHIEVIQWPEILIVHINDRKNTTKYRKPPETRDGQCR